MTDKLIVSSMAELKNSAFDLHAYDRYIIYFSAGKDSTALVLFLIDQGVDKSKIELHHHDIDGREGSTLMDWPITRGYTIAFAAAFGLPVYFSWKQGGFEKEMLRDNELTASTIFEDQNHNLITIGGTRGNKNTRRQFPQVSPDLSVRWCSAYLKIDIGAAAIRNQDRFNNSRTLTLSGERGEESSARSKYKVLEPDRSDNRDGKNKRYVDRLRPIKDWTEQDVWDIIKKYKVRVHPAYYLGWGRVSCLNCIFGNKNQFASAAVVSPCGIQKIIDYEKDFGKTIKRKQSIEELIKEGKPYVSMTDDLINLARSEEYTIPIIMNDGEAWVLPAGAFGDNCGPT